MKRSPAAMAMAVVAVGALVASAVAFGAATLAVGTSAGGADHPDRSFVGRTPQAEPTPYRICTARPGDYRTC